MNDPLLAPLLVSRKEAFNKYSVTAIAVYLHEDGVYQFASATAMHLQLEDTDERNKYYKNYSYYAPNREAICALRSIVKQSLIV